MTLADLFDKLSAFTLAKEAMEMGIYPFFRALSNSEGTTATFEDKDVVMLGSNNYLGLTTDERVQNAAIEATRRYGTSVTGSRFLNGTLELHLEADRRLAEFVGKEAALVFSTGYQTNLGTVSALLGKNDVVILDKDAHASLVDGVAMSRGQMKRFKHNDIDDLERVLCRVPDEAGKLVIVDGVYSMGGDFARLPEIVTICHAYGARLLVDDAHGIGVAGGGRGTSAHFGLTDQVDLIMGTFSKSFASIGGFIAGSADVIHYVQHHARSLIFSAALPAPNLAAVLAALDIIESEPEHVQQVWKNADYMRKGLKTLGYDTFNSETPIIPVIIGEKFRTGLTWLALIEEGVYTNPVVPPATPPNQALLRTSYIATHQQHHLDRALVAFETVGRNLDLIPG
ncbi:MAG: aminotransferase class I/II-fold pyridoxal phosphate-dependent enzyme [Chloroflexi bacterium]|nr:aminotransferase class I/II-fold pyridoxal phosphate-dependent enzyme [Chloroflexota bacterium]